VKCLSGKKIAAFVNKEVDLMRKLVVFGVLAVLFFCLPAVAQIKLKDVPDGHWAADAVYDLLRLGVTKGYPDGTFRGNKNITRYETAAFLSRLAAAIKVPPAAGGISEEEVRKIVKDEVAAQKVEKAGAAVSGVVYFSWQNGLENYTKVNDFDIERVYVTIKNKLGENASSRVTFDVARGATTLNSYLKYAYVDLKDVYPKEFQLFPKTVNLRVGLLPTSWIGYVDKILGIRYISKNLTDINKVLTSADFGVGANGKVSIPGLPDVNFDGSVVNGAGYKSAETNRGKNINFRVDSEVYSGLSVALGGQIADIDNSGSGAKLANALIAYKADQVKAYAEYLYGAGKSGYSLGGIFSLGSLSELLSGTKIFGRFDNYDPNRSTANDQNERIIAGVSQDLNKNVQIAADYVSTKYSSAAPSNAGQTVAVAEIRTQIKF
jgi:hypothetical protein